MPTADQDQWVTSVLGVAPKPGEKGGSSSTAGSGMAKLPALWSAAERAVETDIKALRGEILAEYGDDPAAKDAEAGLEAHTNELLRLFDGRFASALQAAGAGPGGGADAIRTLIADCAKRVADDATIRLFDGNPFVDVDIAGHLRSALEGMAKALG